MICQNVSLAFLALFREISHRLTAAIPVKAPIPLVIPIKVPAKFGARSKALTFIPKERNCQIDT